MIRTFMVGLLLATALGLAGCFASIPEVQYIPITEVCKVEIPAEPQYRYSPPYDDIFMATKDLLGDNKAKDGHIAELAAALKSCK